MNTISLAPDIILVAVTKTFPFSVVDDAYHHSFRQFGENRVEEAREKIEEAKKHGYSDVIWHMIGHVQSRKADDVAFLFDWVESVDSVAIAQKLNTAASRLGKMLHVFLEVNLSGETSKFGFDLADWEHKKEKLHNFERAIEEIVKLPYLTIEGIMTMPPYVTKAQDNRTIFQSMKKLSETIRVHNSYVGSQLSMGTSCDYRVAIEEGATQVRLGEALFGKHPLAIR